MAQNEQTTEEHSTLEQQSPGRLDHPAWCVVWSVCQQSVKCCKPRRCGLERRPTDTKKQSMSTCTLPVINWLYRCTTSMKNIHDDLSSPDLGIHEARDLAQNRPLWTLASLHSATLSQRCMLLLDWQANTRPTNTLAMKQLHTSMACRSILNVQRPKFSFNNL